MKRYLFIVICIVGIGILTAHADTFNFGASMSSDAFRIIDSQHGAFGGTASSSSSSFGLLGDIGDIAIGSSSFTSFSLHAGFMYFPSVVAPVLTGATAGNGQVSLTWTAAQAFGDWHIGGYNVCTKPSGSSFSCADSTTSTSLVKTGLTNSVTYTFHIEAKDGLGNIIAVSGDMNATPVAPSGGGGGGGGGSYIPPTSGSGTIILRGIAYPNSTVNIYRDGTLVTSIAAGGTATFSAQLNAVPSGMRTIGINSQDPNGRKSITMNIQVTVTANISVTLSDILLPPTIDLSSYQLNHGDILRIFGQAAPISEVNIHVASNETITKVVTDSTGAYAITYDTNPLAEEDHTAKSRDIFNQVVSPFSQVLQFVVGRGGAGCGVSGDVNKDCKVNIVDVSILLFWWNTNQQKGLDVGDINHDGRVSIVDFSIMLFHWTT